MTVNEGSLSADDLREIAAPAGLGVEVGDEGRRDDDELHAYLVSELGIDVPRVAACHDHDAPFDAFADLYFERDLAALWLAPRGGAKTFLAAAWHLLSSR